MCCQTETTAATKATSAVKLFRVREAAKKKAREKRADGMTEPTNPETDFAELIREAEKHERYVERRVVAVYWALFAAAVFFAAIKGGWAIGACVAFALGLVSMFFLPFIRKTLPLFIP